VGQPWLPGEDDPPKGTAEATLEAMTEEAAALSQRLFSFYVDAAEARYRRLFGLLGHNVVAVELLTLLFAAIAAVGSVVRVAQNERLYRWHKKTRKKKKKK
jgi:hypothetical protein